MFQKIVSHDYGMTRGPERERSKIKMPSRHKTTIDENKLYPIYHHFVEAGDTMTMRAFGFVRLSTPKKPVMDNIKMTLHWFFVRKRIVWDNYKKFFGERTNPGDTTEYLIPQIQCPSYADGGVPEDHLFAYMGVPIGPLAVGNPGLMINAWLPRAYNMIYNYWYRKAYLIDTVPEHKDDGPDPIESYSLLNRAKRADYFTTALPKPSRQEVLLTLGESAPIVGTITNPLGQLKFGDTLAQEYGLSLITGSPTPPLSHTATIGSNIPIFPYVEEGSLEADLSEAIGISVRSFRESIQLQRLYDKDNRGGYLYRDLLKMHFGTSNGDAVLNIPEYLGGCTVDVNIHPIAQASSTVTGSPQGNLAAFGTASINGNGFTKSFTEAGMVMGIVSVDADLNYQQGLERDMFIQTRLEEYWPTFNHIGEQVVYNKEIFATGLEDDEHDLKAFGFQEQYGHKKYQKSLITGKFNSACTAPLDNWHLAQEFSECPELGQDFIEVNVPMGRVLVVETEPHFIVDMAFDMTKASEMPMYSIPGLMDHL